MAETSLMSSFYIVVGKMMKREKIYGIHPVMALLRTHSHLVDKIYYLKQRTDQRVATIRSLALAASVPVEGVSRRFLEDLLEPGVCYQGVVAIVHALPTYEESTIPALLTGEDGLFLVLDGVQDPHNLGACLRSANAMGVLAVIVPKNRAVKMTPTVRKVACGAAELTPFIVVTNLVRTLKFLQSQGIWVVGATGDADLMLSEVNFTGATALVMGGEQKGLRRLTRECCDFLAAIPMSGVVSSFNVSVATGICLYEACRQRLN